MTRRHRFRSAAAVAMRYARKNILVWASSRDEAAAVVGVR